MSADAQSQSPPHRYDASMANEIEARWQQRWDDDKVFEAPNPTGDLSAGFDRFASRDHLFVMDMFPYPSGSGLHVGHPLGYIGTDVLARFGRMSGRNVLHTMGYDAFGLPAEQYAVQTGRHPRITTDDNVANMRRQLGRLGLGHDLRRSVSTTDVSYYRWTQWIFLQIFNSWFDRDSKRARPIDELVAELDSGVRSLDDGRSWTSLSPEDKRVALLDYRLTYVDEAPVNWCPGLGTVLANEEVTNEGRSERGNFPVYRRPMRQWKMRITEYAERLIDDLDKLDWPESVKAMQRNWIGRSTGAFVDFALDNAKQALKVFTTRPDTLFGATYMVIAPEHWLVEQTLPDSWPTDTPESWKNGGTSPRQGVDSYVNRALNVAEIERTDENRPKTGVFTGVYATNPVNGEGLPVFVADYVLGGYGTGAIMAVPAHDERDFQFARTFSLAMTAVVRPTDEWLTEHGVGTDATLWSQAYTGPGTAMNSNNADVSLDNKSVEDAKIAIAEWLTAKSLGGASTTYKLRDWLFSRQRYWGEPFPIVWDGDVPIGVPESLLPIELPALNDYAPVTSPDNEAQPPEPPLGRAEEWRVVTLDLGDGKKQYRRELNTMPQWAGSCWYYLRYMDPTNDKVLVDPEIERYWSGTESDKSGAVDLYIGGVEHAVLHLLYARFWHKVLFDLGHVSKPEPFQRLFNQGMILADAFTDSRGIYVDAHSVSQREDGSYEYENAPVQRITGKMGKSLKNSVNPDDIYRDFGADSLRLYEMAMGPLDSDRPWSDQGIVGLYRFLQRLWRNFVDEETGDLRLATQSSDDTVRLLHKTIAGVRSDFEGLRFNTAVSKLIELNNHLTKVAPVDRSTAEATVLMLAPLAPHISEELWSKLGHAESLSWESFPEVDQALLTQDFVEVPVQVQGKVRGKVGLAVGAGEEQARAAALAEPAVAKHLEGREIKKVVVIPDRMINIVLG